MIFYLIMIVFVLMLEVPSLVLFSSRKSQKLLASVNRRLFREKRPLGQIIKLYIEGST